MAFEIIDFHTHPFIDPQDNHCVYKEWMNVDKKAGESVAVDNVTVGNAAMGKVAAGKVAVRNVAVAAGIMDSRTMEQDLADAGVTRFCGSVVHTNLTGFETLRKCNRDALKLREMYGDKYIPGFHIHPAYMEESIAEMEFAARNNIRIIGELVPYMHGWSDYSCDQFSELLDVAEKYGFVVSLHRMDLEQMDVMAGRHKNINFVFAHPGEHDKVLRHVAVMKKHDNVHLDLSGIGTLRYGVVRYLVSEVGAERILFGSDYPIYNIAAYISGVLNEKITDREKECIFSLNARRLLKLS